MPELRAAAESLLHNLTPEVEKEPGKGLRTRNKCETENSCVHRENHVLMSPDG